MSSSPIQHQEALVLIDLQRGFLNSQYWGHRNNPQLEANCQKLVASFRASGRPVIHVQHLSTEAKSPLRPGQVGAEFLEGLEPILGERVFQKSVNSAFIGTNLESYLRANQLMSVTLAGLTSDHCVSTTARMAANLGFQVTIVADCTATFDRKRSDVLYPAQLVHEVSLASLNGEFARVIVSL
jgi:nicotinamidase-related amidase